LIASYRDRDTEKVAAGIRVKKFEAVARTAQRKLLALRIASTLEDLALPIGNRLEALKGDRKGQHSVRINDQYRICFAWRKGAAHDVESLLPLITPGEFLSEEFLEPLGLSANALALALRVPANRIQAIVNGQRAISADTALRLAQYFGTTSEFWINLQAIYELDKAKREKLEQIRAQVPRRAPAA